MTRAATTPRLLIPVVLALFLVAALFAARSQSASGMSRQVVKTAMNAKLHEKVLVNRRGLTLYSLSAEQRGRFICANTACLSLWTPLVVSKGTTPAGAPHLSTVRRPDGRLQVAFQGRPVYTFKGDRKPGDVKGNGFMDVGVWRPASTSSTKSTTPAPPANPYPGYPGYGG